MEPLARRSRSGSRPRGCRSESRPPARARRRPAAAVQEQSASHPRRTGRLRADSGCRRGSCRPPASRPRPPLRLPHRGPSRRSWRSSSAARRSPSRDPLSAGRSGSPCRRRRELRPDPATAACSQAGSQRFGRPGCESGRRRSRPSSRRYRRSARSSALSGQRPRNCAAAWRSRREEASSPIKNSAAGTCRIPPGGRLAMFGSSAGRCPARRTPGAPRLEQDVSPRSHRYEHQREEQVRRGELHLLVASVESRRQRNPHAATGARFRSICGAGTAFNTSSSTASEVTSSANA